MEDGIRRIEGRVRALLAKAEHPGTPLPEAEAAHAKAAELMLRYALDEAALRVERGTAPDPPVYWEHVALGGDGHGRARCTALGAVVQAYGGRYARLGNGVRRTDVTLLVVTTRAARNALALLLPSLALQMDQAGARETGAYMAAVPENGFARRSDRTRWANGYHRAFLIGYGDAVARRVASAREDLRTETTSTALVLAGDDARVEAAFTERFPHLARGGRQRIRTDGYTAGRQAGRSADLGTAHLPHTPPALGPA